MREVEIEVTVAVNDGDWKNRVSKSISIDEVEAGEVSDALTAAMAGMVPEMIRVSMRKYMRKVEEEAGDE
jgi:hypothetical protein